MTKKIKKFFSEMAEELKKSAWPDRKELGKATFTVIVGMFLISFYVSVVDFSLLNIVDFVSKCIRK
ncbi:MAG: preprotein translocase subunit SecE [Puniceicoccales bacterium]|jgi:preprotein translocase subunit SecE|nr:preprotein translocase subunit SecE [Puniceicoccales bacterium]